MSFSLLHSYRMKLVGVSAVDIALCSSAVFCLRHR